MKRFSTVQVNDVEPHSPPKEQSIQSGIDHFEQCWID
jgi:hypothetical protein